MRTLLKPYVLGMFALLSTTQPYMRVAIDCLKREGLGGKVKVIIGGAPSSAGFAQEMGADAYALMPQKPYRNERVSGGISVRSY